MTGREFLTVYCSRAYARREVPDSGIASVWKRQYELCEPPLMVVACHCRECQQPSTSAFSSTAVARTSAVGFHGEVKEWSRAAESGNINRARFCPVCGKRIYHVNPDEPDRIKLKPGNLSATRMIEPTVHVWLSENRPWFRIPDNVKVFDRQP